MVLTQSIEFFREHILNKFTDRYYTIYLTISKDLRPIKSIIARICINKLNLQIQMKWAIRLADKAPTLPAIIAMSVCHTASTDAVAVRSIALYTCRFPRTPSRFHHVRPRALRNVQGESLDKWDTPHHRCGDFFLLLSTLFTLIDESDSIR